MRISTSLPSSRAPMAGRRGAEPIARYREPLFPWQSILHLRSTPPTSPILITLTEPMSSNRPTEERAGVRSPPASRRKFLKSSRSLSIPRIRPPSSPAISMVSKGAAAFSERSMEEQAGTTPARVYPLLTDWERRLFRADRRGSVRRSNRGQEASALSGRRVIRPKADD
jgi:hypothetical protein